MWLTLILVTVAVYALRYFYDTIRAFWIARNIDGPPGLPIIGNALLFVNKTPAGKHSIVIIGFNRCFVHLFKTAISLSDWAFREKFEIKQPSRSN